MERRFQSGIVKNVQNHIYRNRESTIDRGASHVRQRNVPSVDSTEFVGEERTFDTWMDSSVSPLFITKFKKDEEFFKRTYPTGVRPQAKDIVRTWLYYTLLRCENLTGEKPWSEAWIMG